MPSKKGMDQALTWLRSMAASPGLDGINAEVCLNVIRDLQEQNNRKGAIIHRLREMTEGRETFRESYGLVTDDFYDN